MEQYIMKGGNPLVGEVTISGAKNAALGILAAAIMTDDDVVIDNLPDVSDINALLEAISHLGASQEEASSLHPGGPCPESHRRCVLAGVRDEGKVVVGERRWRKLDDARGPFGRRGIARLLWRCEEVEGS